MKSRIERERAARQALADFLSLTPAQMAEHAPRLAEDPDFQKAKEGVVRDLRVEVAAMTLGQMTKGA